VAVTHTYRDAKVLDSWAPQRADVVSGLAAVLIFAWLFMVGLKTGVPIGVWAQGLVAVGLTCGAAAFLGRRYELRRCGEIRLDDKAGTCELGTRQGVITLNVSEITSVEYETDGDMSYEYRVCHEEGAVPVEKGMVDFSDFLARLKSLNPDVDFRRIPAGVWSGSDTTRMPSSCSASPPGS
jgi:hypothetical protein